MTTWSQVEKDTGFGFIVTVSLPAVLTKTVLRREELRPETLTKSEGFSETHVLLSSSCCCHPHLHLSAPNIAGLGPVAAQAP